MRQPAKGERELVYVLRVVDQLHDKVAAADVMEQVAEKFVAGWIVAHILNQAAAVGIGVGAAQVIFCGIGITLQKETLEVALPHKVNYLLVGEHGVGRQRRSAEQDHCYYQQRGGDPRPLGFHLVQWDTRQIVALHLI